ncbi:Tubby-related protein 4 [Tupaia chinensis]|uniref:Tubby-related protein 4 n=1 Tax=Tupaia chinensis TaxID=246437 RepID=L9JZN6_TUPCH|nr:Tubby-related protein 4 [Tupaia chinensis]
MYAAVEHGPVLCSDSNILCLSWKGRVPKSEKEKPVCRRRYYEEGWLATGNGRGVVGVTFTSSHCRRDRSTPQRINFNLRGHNSEAPLLCSTSVRVITASLKGSRHWEGGWGTFLQAGVGLDAPSNLCCAVSMAEHSQVTVKASHCILLPDHGPDTRTYPSSSTRTQYEPPKALLDSAVLLAALEDSA